MALKDWKKIGRDTKNSFGFYNDKKDMRLIAEKTRYSFLGEQDFWVFRLSASYSLQDIPYTRFKTKSQALKFAKSYMRTH